MAKQSNSAILLIGTIGVFGLMTSCESSNTLSNTWLSSDTELQMPTGWDNKIFKMVQEENLKPVIAVLDVETKTNFGETQHIKLVDILINYLQKSQKFDLVERSKIDRVIKEHQIALNRLTLGKGETIPLFNQKTVPEVGKLLGADYLFFGAISSATQDTIDKFAYDVERVKVSVEVRGVDTTKGQIAFSGFGEGVVEEKIITTARGVVISGAEDFQAAFSNAAQAATKMAAFKIADSFPLLGYVADVRQQRIYLDIGEDRGIRKGDEFIVFRMGKTITHPTTGKHLGWEKAVLGSVKIIGTEKGMSVANLERLKDSKLPIAAGDLAIITNDQ